MNIIKQIYKFYLDITRFIGDLLSKVFMSLVFYTVFVFGGILLKLLGKDLLNKKICESENTYWVDREIQPTSLKRLF